MDVVFSYLSKDITAVIVFPSCIFLFTYLLFVSRDFPQMLGDSWLSTLVWGKGQMTGQEDKCGGARRVSWGLAV